MTKFIDVLRSEILKTKRTYNLNIVILFPLIISLLFFVHYAKIFYSPSKGAGMHHWLNYSRNFFMIYNLLFPLVAALVAFSLSNIEHKNNAYKLLFTLPIKKYEIYFSKVLILIFWLLILVLLAYSLLILSGNTLSYLLPHLGFQDYNINQAILTYFIRAFFTLFSIISIHFFLSMYWSNFIISVGSACFFVIFGSFLANWEYSCLIPYCNFMTAFHDVYNNSHTVFTKEIIYSLLYSVVFFLGGYIIMNKKRRLE